MDIKLISITPKGTRKEFALTDSVTVYDDVLLSRKLAALYQ